MADGFGRAMQRDEGSLLDRPGEDTRAVAPSTGGHTSTAPGSCAGPAGNHQGMSQPASGPRSPATRPAEDGRRSPLPGTPILLGLGLGGFVDGIVLHQILQWHHMLSSTDEGSLGTLAGLRANTLADGVFHASTWLLTAIGVWLLWRDATLHRVPSGRKFLGGLILGWGLFNIVDEIVFHALLDLHHIREGPDEMLYDMVFLAIGISQVAIGRTLMRERAEHR